MSDIKVALIQSSLFWEDPKANKDMFEKKICAINEPVDIVVLPEVFTTGYTMDPSNCAEKFKGETFEWMKKLAEEKKFVIIGTMPTLDNGKYYNRLIWMQPDGSFHRYDKKHLFTFAGETKNYTPGKERMVVEYKGWKFLLNICYDLRFPVWSKNNYSVDEGFEFDCIINVANWPAVRSKPWSILLMARAIENQAYMIGVNRLGEDANGVDHSGDSAVICPKGEKLSSFKSYEDKTEIITLSRKNLDDFRKKFRVAEDWDRFEILD